VNTIAKDPLKPLEFSSASDSQYETKVLKMTIEKITGLLRVGFGEAGLHIYSRFIKDKFIYIAFFPLRSGYYLIEFGLRRH